MNDTLKHAIDIFSFVIKGAEESDDARRPCRVDSEQNRDRLGNLGIGGQGIMNYTIVLDAIQKECVLNALMEKAYSLPKNHPARVNYENTYKQIKQQLKNEQQ